MTASEQRELSRIISAIRVAGATTTEIRDAIQVLWNCNNTISSKSKLVMFLSITYGFTISVINCW